MKSIEKTCTAPLFQGDCMLLRTESIPAEATQSKDTIIAHSETGHHHTVEGATVWQGKDPLTSWIKPEPGREYVDVVHRRSWDTHETLRLFVDGPNDMFVVRRQREWAPEGWKRVED